MGGCGVWGLGLIGSEVNGAQSVRPGPLRTQGLGIYRSTLAPNLLQTKVFSLGGPVVVISPTARASLLQLPVGQTSKQHQRHKKLFRRRGDRRVGAGVGADRVANSLAACRAAK